MPRLTVIGHWPSPNNQALCWLVYRRVSHSMTSLGSSSFLAIAILRFQLQALAFFIVFNRDCSRVFPVLDMNKAGTADKGLEGHHRFQRGGDNHLEAEG